MTKLKVSLTIYIFAALIIVPLTRIDNVTLQCLHLNLQGRYNQLSTDFSIGKLILYLNIAL